MTNTIDTECMILVATLKRDMEALKKMRKAAADALLAVYRTAVPLRRQEESLEAMLEGLNQAILKSRELTNALGDLARRVEQDEITGHEMAEILARKHYLNRQGYMFPTYPVLALKRDAAMDR